MARQRKKSINDILQQQRRIERMIMDNWPQSKRLDRVNAASNRYIQNIIRSKEFNKFKNKEFDAAMKLGSTPEGMGGSMAKYHKVSRSTYMGLSKG